MDVKLDPALQDKCMIDLGKWCSEKTETGQVTVHGTAAASSSEPGGWEGHEEGGIKEHLVASCPFIAQILLKMHAV